MRPWHVCPLSESHQSNALCNTAVRFAAPTTDRDFRCGRVRRKDIANGTAAAGLLNDCKR
jgi:hypothetical protein